MNSAKQEILDHYLDSDLLVTIDRDPSKWSTGNGLMHLGFFTCLLFGSEQLNFSDVDRFKAAVFGCQVERGLYDRNKGRSDRDSRDDADGVVAGSVVTNSEFHEDVLIYGLKHFFLYDNTGSALGLKSLWAWRLRFPVVILWYLLVNYRLRPLLTILTLCLRLSLLKSAADSTIENYCKVESLAAKYPKLKSFRNSWLKKSNLEAKTAEYFNAAGRPEHPLVQLTRELKELK